MNKKLIIKRHFLSDRIPLISAAVLMLVAQILPMTAVASIMELFFKDSDENVLTFYNLAIIAVSFIMLWLFRRWFFPEYEGSAGLKGLGYGMKIALPVIVFIIGWRILKIAVGYESFELGGYYTVLMGARAGINEEIAFRGLAVAFLCRSFRDSKRIWIPPVFAGVFFGCTHLINLFSGDELLGTLVNTLFAASVGVLFGILFTMSGNLWPVMIVHSLYDVLAFASIDNDMPDWMTLTEVGIFIVIMAIYIYVLQKNKDKAAAVWDIKWKKAGDGSASPEADHKEDMR